MSDDPRIGFFAAAQDLAHQAGGGHPVRRSGLPSRRKLIFNLQLDGWLTVVLLAIVWIIVIDMARGCWLHLSGRRVAASTESPYVATQLA